MRSFGDKMYRMLSPVFVLLFVLFISVFGKESAERQNHTCASQTGALYLKECNATLSECLLRKRECPLALRLNTFREWLDSIGGKGCSTIVREVEERYRSMTDTARYEIDSTILTYVGNTDAPIRIVMYISLTCPLCKWIYQEIWNSIVGGVLKDKAKLAAKPFSSNSYNIALLAAGKLGKQDALLLSLADVKEQISGEMILEKAEEIGIAKTRFQNLLKDPALREAAERSHLEAVRNGVKITPTIFINGHRYRSYKNSRWIIDAAEYSYEALLTNRRLNRDAGH